MIAIALDAVLLSTRHLAIHCLNIKNGMFFVRIHQILKLDAAQDQ